MIGRCSPWPRPSSPARASSPPRTTARCARSSRSSTACRHAWARRGPPRIEPWMPPRGCGPAVRSTRSRWRASRRCSADGSETLSCVRRCRSSPASTRSSTSTRRTCSERWAPAPEPPIPVTEPRWARQAHAAESWTGGDVECDVVVIGTGAGGAVVGHALAARGHAVVFVEEGQLYHRHAFDGSSVRAYERFYRPVFSVGNASFPIFIGRMVGGSTAINGGTAFRTPDRVLDRWCEETSSDALSPARMAPVLRAGRDPPRRGPVVAPLGGANRRGDAARLRRAGVEARGPAPERAGLRGLRLLSSRLPERRAEEHEPLVPAARARAGRAALHRPEGRAGAPRERPGHGPRGRRGERQPGPRPGPRGGARRRQHLHAAVPPQAGAGQLQRTGGQEPHGAPQRGRDRDLRRGDAPVRPHPPGLRLGAVPRRGAAPPRGAGHPQHHAHRVPDGGAPADGAARAAAPRRRRGPAGRGRHPERAGVEGDPRGAHRPLHGDARRTWPGSSAGSSCRCRC